MPVAYRLVYSNDATEFENTINSLLKKGWTFHGPTIVKLLGEHGGQGWYQPMIQLEVQPVKMGKMDTLDIVSPMSGIMTR